MCDGQKHSFSIINTLDKNKKTAWFHCASLGEFEQARNLIEVFKNKYPSYNILITFFSPSGYEVRKNYSKADAICYLPFDTPLNAKRFVKTINPSLVFFIKYEFWWNYIIALKDTPLYSVSLILREGHYLTKSYNKWFAKQLKNFTYFFVQNRKTKDILDCLGYKNSIIAGDTRFDRVFTMSKEGREFPLIREFCSNKPIFLAGSSWPDDELLIVKALQDNKQLKIILAPHLIDKEHINNLLKLFNNSIELSKLTEENCNKYDVLIVDCIGILMYLYSMCNIAYIGGGFGVGIHNILEAAVFSKPILFGPNNKKFQEAQDLLSLGVAKEIHSADDISFWVNRLVNNQEEYNKLSSLASSYVRENVGATEKILNAICSEI